MKAAWLLAICFAAIAWFSATGRGAEPALEVAGKTEAAPAEAKYLRIRRDEARQPLAMETAVVHFTSPQRQGVSIDLIGAVHVGDQSYYEALNKLFETYDVVLYELVAPEGTRIPKGGRSTSSLHPIGVLQNGMSSILELAHQLNCVDYTKPNLVHADMSPEEFNKSMEDRGDGFLQIFLRLMGTGIAQNAAGANGANDAALLMALFSKDRATKLKVVVAQQFESLDGQLAALDGPEGSTIITERNKRCFAVLDKELAAGKKRIGIFYGAGHFPDMERRLTADYGFQRDSEKWLTAWNLAPPVADREQPEK